MLTISGVSAEEIDVDSSVMAESPISADLVNSLSSCDASSNDLSYCEYYDLSDSVESYSSLKGYGSYESYVSCESSSLNSDDSINFNQFDVKSQIGGMSDVGQSSLAFEAVDNVVSNNHDFDLIFESDKFSGDVIHQMDNLLGFENAGTVLTGVTVGFINVRETNNPVFNGIFKASGYISDDEVYFGTISDRDFEMFLESVGGDNAVMFAVLTQNSALDISNGSGYGQIGEYAIEGYSVANALLMHSSEGIIISLADDIDEDELSHVINDTNSHGLDYAYVKHLKVIYKDMPNLMVFNSCGSEKLSAAGYWDGLNDILGRVSSETLLPDHNAIWTPLLLSLQQDLHKSIVGSHADDNENQKADNDTEECDACNCSDEDCDCINCACKYSKTNKKHLNGGEKNYRHWEHNKGYSDYSYHVASAGVETTRLNETLNDNVTDDKNSSSNLTATSDKEKPLGKTSAAMKTEPTYTFIYAIIGIAFVCLLFDSSYMKRDD